MQEERMINIKDLLYHICLKWRVMLIWMLVFAVLLNGFAIFKTKRTLKFQEQQELQKGDMTVYTENMTDIDKDAVIRAFEIYKQSSDSSEMLHDFMSESILMNLDKNEVPTVYMIYKATGVSNLPGLLAYIGNTTLSSDWRKQLIDKLGWDVEVKDINGLIEMNVLNEDSEETEIHITNDSENEKYKVFRVHIMAPDQESAELIASEFDNVLKNSAEQIRNDYEKGVGLKLVSNAFRYENNTKLVTDQQWYLEKLNSYNTYINNSAYYFTEEQKAYYRALVRNLKENEENATEAESTVKEALVKPQIPLIHKKYIALGLVAGLFLSACLYAVLYIFGKRLHTIRDLQNFYGVPVLGIITNPLNDKKKKGIDGIIYKVFKDGKIELTEEEQIQMICGGLEIVLKKNGIKRLHLTGAATTGGSKTLKQELIQRLSGKDVEITSGNSILFDHASLMELSDAEGTILIEEIDVSLFDDIQKELDLCKEYKVPVLGAVVME